ncbi:MAG: hypothetical protein ACLP8A_01645 [Methylovirgula sp.]
MSVPPKAGPDALVKATDIDHAYGEGVSPRALVAAQTKVISETSIIIVENRKYRG